MGCCYGSDMNESPRQVLKSCPQLAYELGVPVQAVAEAIEKRNIGPAITRQWHLYDERAIEQIREALRRKEARR